MKKLDMHITADGVPSTTPIDMRVEVETNLCEHVKKSRMKSCSIEHQHLKHRARLHGWQS